MRAYYILTEPVTDPQKHSQEYFPGAMPFLEKYKADVVAAIFEAAPLQRDLANGGRCSALPLRKHYSRFCRRSGLPPNQKAPPEHHSQFERGHGAGIPDARLVHWSRSG